MNKLRQMMLFMHIVETGSITAAAERLELSKSVLSQHLKALEAELGTTLLKRTTRRQSLTEAGQGFYQHCREICSRAELAWDEVLERQQAPGGRLKVTAPHALMDSMVLPALVSCFAGFPGVQLQLLCQDQQLDLMTEDIDLAVRVGESVDSRYRQKRIGSFNEVLCRAKGDSRALADTAYIANHWQGRQISHTIEGMEYQFTPCHSTNTVSQTQGLIRAGVGIGVLPEFMLDEGIDVITQLAPVNVYTLHPFEAAVPLTVTMAQQAIASAFNPTDAAIK